MPSYKWNGTTATIAGTASVKIVQSTHDEGQGEIDVTHSTSTGHEYEEALDDDKITFDCLGADAITRGQSGATVITWTDGGSTPSFTGVVVGKSKAGSIDNRVVYSITIRRGPT